MTHAMGYFLSILVKFQQTAKDADSLLLLDKSMSGWRPKTTRTGGLPTNVTFEPRILSSWYHAKIWC